MKILNKEQNLYVKVNLIFFHLFFLKQFYLQDDHLHYLQY